ncbi:hypothetical protein DCAR_0311676 [Daucus carota subsp. sativus]|uniref:Uncharacterized protein n=1 Tax=Daucus carota subsp. sativus TaxID=79200 RepID=A0AAF0WQR1_DAUCS|nr:hypothetical protein DCAR_0311676 [Daucus carota subsp. sativus]
MSSSLFVSFLMHIFFVIKYLIYHSSYNHSFIADNPSVYHQKRKICECTTKYDHGCVLDACEGLCAKLDLTIAGYCIDKSTCLCIYVC